MTVKSDSNKYFVSSDDALAPTPSPEQIEPLMGELKAIFQPLFAYKKQKAKLEKEKQDRLAAIKRKQQQQQMKDKLKTTTAKPSYNYKPPQNGYYKPTQQVSYKPTYSYAPSHTCRCPCPQYISYSNYK